MSAVSPGSKRTDGLGWYRATSKFSMRGTYVQHVSLRLPVDISHKTVRPLYLFGLGRNSWPLRGLAQTKRQLEAGTVNARPSSGDQVSPQRSCPFRPSIDGCALLASRPFPAPPTANGRPDGRTLRNVPSMASSCERKPWTCSTATRHSRHDAGWTWIPADRQRGRTWNSSCVHSTASPSTQPDLSEVEPAEPTPPSSPTPREPPGPIQRIPRNLTPQSCKPVLLSRPAGKDKKSRSTLRPRCRYKSSTGTSEYQLGFRAKGPACVRGAVQKIEQPFGGQCSTFPEG